MLQITMQALYLSYTGGYGNALNHIYKLRDIGFSKWNVFAVLQIQRIEVFCGVKVAIFYTANLCVPLLRCMGLITYPQCGVVRFSSTGRKKML